MTITITIEMENAAFDGYPGLEVARILKEQVIPKLKDGAGKRADDWKVRDINGNTTGTVVIK